MTHVIHRMPLQAMPKAVGGDGIYVIDPEGNRYLDASGGAAVSNLGHNHPAIVEAIRKQASTLAYAHSGFFTTEPLEELADRLAQLTQAGPQYTFISNSGSEAVETAIKLARQYAYEIGESKRSRIIARKQSYHGGTIAALSVGEHAARRQPYEAILLSATHIDPYYPYRFQREDESEDIYARRSADQLEHAILENGPENVLAFIAETVGGATAGVLIPSAKYLQRIRKICDKYGILLILDEVMCGMGRIGSHFAFNRFGVKPDLVAIGKGLGGGYQPIGATICSSKIYDSICENSGIIHHGSTYSGHATCCAAAIAVLDTIKKENLLENVKLQGKRLLSQLRDSLSECAYVGDIRGIGLFMAVEFVADRETRKPLSSKLKFNGVLKRHALQNQLMCYPCGGTVDGFAGDHVILAPPFIIDERDVEAIVTRFRQSVADAIDEIESKGSSKSSTD